MRLFTIALLVGLALPAAATARGRGHTVAPPGVSGIQQYVETIPTAHGGQPTSSVHSSSGHPGVGGGASGGGGGTSGGSGGVGSGSGSISPSTQRALGAQGAAGRAAAALAAATAPAAAQHRAGTSAGGGGNSGAGDVSSSVSSVSHATSTSPVSAVFKALTGSSSGGGLGVLLPIILIVCVLGFSTVAIVRRRRTTS